MTGEELRLRFTEIAKHGFGHDHDEYLASTGKKFWGIAVNRASETHERLFGDPEDSVLGKQSPDSHAGYSVGAPGRPQGESVDVLLFATEYLVDDSKAELRDALLLHEACHLIIDAGLERLAFEAVDTQRATDILRSLHPEDRYHNLDFLRQLSAATRRLGEIVSAGQHFSLAMSLDTYHDGEVSDSDVEDDG